MPSNLFCNYYGSLIHEKPVRSFSEDCLREFERQMIEDLKSMEERIKRHITECKREVIKELILLKSKGETEDGNRKQRRSGKQSD